MTTEHIAVHDAIYGSHKSTTIWRGVMSVIAVLQIFAGLSVYKGLRNAFFISHIGGMFIAGYYISALLHSLSKRDNKSFLTNWTTGVFQMTVSIQFMIFVFYWGLMAYKEFLRVMSNPDKKVAAFELFIQIVQHLAYPLLMLFTMLLERTAFKMSNVILIIGFAIFYMIINGYVTITTGEPIYDIIDWKTASSHIHLALGLSLVFLGFYLSTKLSRLMNKTLGFTDSKSKLK